MMYRLSLSLAARCVAIVCFGAVVLAGGCTRGGEQRVARTSLTLLVTSSAPEVWRASLNGTAAGLRERLRADVSIRPVPRPEDVQDALLACGQTERDMVVCLGAECGTAVFTVAPIYPTTRFLVIPGVRHERNVAAATFEINEAAYVAGAAFSALGPTLEIGVPDENACPEGFVSALVAGVRSRGVEPVVRGVWAERSDAREMSAEGLETPSEERPLVRVCCGGSAAGEGDRGAVREPDVTLAVDTCLTDRFPGRTVAAVDVDLEEAIVRIAQELLDRSEPGRAFAFDLGSGVVDLEISGPDDEPLPAEVRRELATARDEVVAGIAEIDSLGI